MRCLTALLAFGAFLLPASAQVPPALEFIENRGQIRGTHDDVRPDVRFVLVAPGVRVYVRTTGLSYVFSRAERDTTSDGASGTPWSTPRAGAMQRVETYRLDVDFVGASSHVEIVPDVPTGSLRHYYPVCCASGPTGVASYRRITYRELYPGIDLVLNAGPTGMKYDLVVRPGADPRAIAFRYVGADSLGVRHDGSLDVTTPLGSLRDARPESFQLATSRRMADTRSTDTNRVATRFRVRDTTVGFEVGSYDPRRPLVIDPALVWATYLGGNGVENLGWTYWGGRTLSLTRDGSVLTVVVTASTDFPVTPGALITTLTSVTDVTVSKFTPLGAMVWSTYLGAVGGQGDAIALDSTGAIYVGGQSAPGLTTTVGAHQATAASVLDGFIMKLDSNGARVWSTYYGGTHDGDAVTDLAVMPGGELLVTMGTSSAGLATPGAYMTTGMGILARFTAAGVRRWATYTASWPLSVSCGASTGVYVGGYGNTSFVTTRGAWQPVCAGAVDAVLMRFESDGSLTWATFLGGLLEDIASGVAVAGDTAVYCTGHTLSGNLPVTARAFQTRFGGGEDNLLARFDSSGLLQWLTYVGGSGIEHGRPALTVDHEGFPYIASATGSTNFPVTADAVYPTRRGAVDAVLARFSPTGRLLWSTFFGGALPPGSSRTYASAVAARGPAVYISGLSYASDLPVTPGAFQGGLHGTSDAFLARFCLIMPRISAGAVFLCPGDSTTLTAPDGYDVLWSTGQRTRSIVVSAPGRYWFRADNEFCFGYSDTVTVVQGSAPSVAISPGPRVPLCGSAGVLLDAGSHARYRWSTGDTTRTTYVRAAGRYSVSVRDAAGCAASDTVEVFDAPRPIATITASSLSFCEGDTVTLTGPAGARSYEWNNGRSASAIRVTEPGTYSLRIVDTNGCTSSSVSITLTALPRPRPAILPADPRLCRGDSLVLTAVGAFVAYRWSNGDTASAIVVRDTGRVRVEVIDSSGCRASSPWCVVAYHTAPPLVIVAPSPAVMCDGEPLTLRAPPGFHALRWSTGDTATAISVARPGRYSLEALDSNGCHHSAEIEVATHPRPVPRLSVAGAVDLCEGDSLLLGLTRDFSTVAWSDGGLEPRRVVRAAGRYSATVVDENGCVGHSDTLLVRAVPAPELALEGAASVCTGSTSRYSSRRQAGVEYTWTVRGGTTVSDDGAGAIEVRWSAEGSGVIRLYARDPVTGCAAEDSITVNVGSALTPRIEPDGPVNVCVGDSLELDAGAGYGSYRWSTGETTRRIVVRSAGTFSVEVTSVEGACRGVSRPVVVALVEPVIPVISTSGSDLVSTPALSYQWLLGGAPVAGATERRLIPAVDGSYRVRTIDSNGCEGVSEPYVVGRTATATIALADVEAAPGEPVELPLRLVESTNLDVLGLTRYELAVRFNKSVLLPRGSTPMGEVVGRDRLVVLTGQRAPGVGEGDIGRLEFTAALGDTNWTPIIVERFRWLEGPAETRVASGSVRIRTEGGWGRYHVHGRLRLEVGPNPVTDAFVGWEMELIEPGRTRLRLVDALGRTVAWLADVLATPGVYRERHDLSGLPAGVYFLVLETPTGRIVRSFVRQ